MKNKNRKRRRDIIVWTVLAIVALLYFTGTPSNLIIDLLMVSLLLAAICYVLVYPLMDTFKEVRSYKEVRRIIKLKQSNDHIDTMSWKEFEIFVAKWLKREGYVNIQLTEHYDLGVDVIAEKDGIKYGVQVKHYTNMVKIEAVRQVVVALKLYKCDRAMVITNSYFSRPAKQLAASQNCVLIERTEFLKSTVTL